MKEGQKGVGQKQKKIGHCSWSLWYIFLSDDMDIPEVFDSIRLIS